MASINYNSTEPKYDFVDDNKVRHISFVNYRKADDECKRIVRDIIGLGCKDVNPRPKWEDTGEPAHTISINGVMSQYDISKGEIPLLTLRPIAVKSAINEILWIYQEASNDLKLLREKYKVKYWDLWALDNDTIGACYGETVKRHHQMERLLDGIEKDPDGRRHIMDLWQLDDFDDPHALKPCMFLSNFNVRHGRDGVDYLDLATYIRSCDYLTAGCSINQFQYYALQCMVAHHFGYTPGIFTWFCNNVQIYDRHIEIAKDIITRNSVYCKPRLVINPEVKSFWDITPNDIKLEGYPREEIAKVNPQYKFLLAV